MGIWQFCLLAPLSCNRAGHGVGEAFANTASTLRQSPSGIFANFRARRMGLPVPFSVQAPVRANVGWPWRMDWGGHDPASPLAEMYIHYHNSGWGLMIFVCGTTFYLVAKR